MRHAFSTAAALIATFSLSLAQNTVTCDPNNKCGSSAPCCSEYGQCGVGAYCLQGCDPSSSFDLGSCMAKPTCKSADFKMDSMDDMQSNEVYLGNASTANWVYSGKPVEYNGDILLTMAQSSGGTLLTSTTYVWYGKVSATLSTSQGQGVVSAFILMSDVKDEIDFEFVGVDMTHAQSNFYWQGVTNYTNSANLTTTDTRQNSHTYTIDWKPDTLTWSVDGQVMRTLNKADTLNTTTGVYMYPQTPSRVQLSLWPAGIATNGNGTINWAGGLIDWNSPYMSSQGYYYATVSDINVQCYDTPSDFKNNFGSKAYYYTDLEGVEGSVAIGNNNTILSSFYASGDNQSYDPNAKASGSATKSTASATATPNTVPGISGGGVRGGDGSSGSGSDSGSGSGTSASAAAGATPTGNGGFDQGLGSTGSSGTSEGSKLIAGSAVALLGFIIAAIVI